MARVPTIAEEDAKRPNRERECLVKERTRLVNRMKGTLARFNGDGVRGRYDAVLASLHSDVSGGSSNSPARKINLCAETLRTFSSAQRGSSSAPAT